MTRDFFWVDTSFLYALFVGSDVHHVEAKSIWSRMQHKRRESVTSSLVVNELGTLLAYRFTHAVALKNTGLVLDSSILHKVWVDDTIAGGALSWWKRYHDQKFSFADCVSFECMRMLGIRQALSFDLDFAIAGFDMIRKIEQV